jgi:hypothetical protein
METNGIVLALELTTAPVEEPEDVLSGEGTDTELNRETSVLPLVD